MFYSFLFLLAIFDISFAADNSECGISPALERYKIFNPNRIVGGENSNEGDFPWYVMVDREDAGQCSGSILTEKWILTAAHCVVKRKNLTILYGSVKWEIMKTQKIGALQYFVHPDYVPYRNDIALIELNGTLEFSEFVQPVCLDHTVDSYPDEILTQCGMGSDFKKRLAGKNDITEFNHYVLQDAPIQHLNASFCGNFDEKREICLGGINHSALHGDSGGPLMAIRDNRWIQIGSSSTGEREGFENETLSIRMKDFYVRLSFYCDWIKETTNNEVQC